ncbi:MAG: 2-oxoacid:ferredoxin oxidoreductase subunit beta [Bacteroidia bacterium]
MNTNRTTNSGPLTKKDFESDQHVRWCPGCGDFVVLATVQKTLPELGIKKENFAFISGIGCSSRFPYYMNTYGFHTIHGRPIAVATGVKIANPELSVWVVTGDGDSMAIGGNHLIHALRRNVDLNILMFNNRIYGLTKGQYSPTSPLGQVSVSTPDGAIEEPFNPAELVIGCHGTFYARVPDNDPKLLSAVIKEASAHKGTSFIEILQNCVIFNDDIHLAVTAKDKKEDNQLQLEHGKPMIFGKERNKGIRLNGIKPEVVTIGENGISEADILVHDATIDDPIMHIILSRMQLPEFPVPVGIIRKVEHNAFDEELHKQIKMKAEKIQLQSVEEMYAGSNVWTIN